MHENGCPLVRAMLQECDEPLVVEIAFAYVIADLNTDVSVSHCTR